MALLEKKLALAGAAALAATLGASEARAASEFTFEAASLELVNSSDLFEATGSVRDDLLGMSLSIDLVDINSSSGGSTLTVETADGSVDFTDGVGFILDATVDIDVTAGALGAEYAFNVTGGDFTLTVGADVFTGNFTSNGTPDLVSFTDTTVTLDGLVFNGVFTLDDGVTFAGLNVEELVDHGTVNGTFTQSNLSANDDSSLDVTVVVPTPGAALAAIPMLGVMGLRRRRRQG